MERAMTPAPTPMALSIVNDTPISKKASGANPFTSLHYMRDYKMRQIGAEMEGKFVGPMPPIEFLETYLPLRNTRHMRWTKARILRFDKVKKQRSETAMYKPLIDAIQPLCSRLEVVDTHAYPDPASGVLNPDLLKPDISIYSRGSARGRPTDFSLMESHIEVKFDENDDPFRDSLESFEHDTEKSKDTKGQITSYAVAQQATQFRTHIFTILACHTYARLLRWDRSGAVVTAAFDFSKRFLADFFWRYDRASLKDRGVDLSVSKPSEAEAELARHFLQCSLKDSLFKFTVHNDKDGEISYYIGGKPTFKGNASPTGRATRTFVVYDLQSKRIVFLKDTWRIDLPGVVKEGEIYNALHSAKVSHIAPFLCGGDISDHRTCTQDFASKSWARPIEKSLRRHHHYRLVLGVVGRDLTSFGSTWEMVSAVRDAIQGHKEAYEKSHILHRDISVGNILITDDGRGLLIDWDLCKHIDALNVAARQSECTGTWQFMSAMLLMDHKPPPIHTLADDLESFLHVLSWVALRFTPHALSSKALTDLLVSMFDHSYEEDGHAKGGLTKKSYLISGEVPRSGFQHPILPALLKKLTATCAVRYEERPSEKELEAYHELQAQQSDMLQNPLILNSAAAKFEQQMAAPETSDWMIKMLSDALANHNAWPSKDKSNPNPLYQGGPRERKRKSADGEVILELPTQKRRFSVPILEVGEG